MIPKVWGAVDFRIKGMLLMSYLHNSAPKNKESFPGDLTLVYRPINSVQSWLLLCLQEDKPSLVLTNNYW